ncbi:MAG: GNAT family N-acetyltransferase [Betaproteobacteria bacterium]
MSATAIRPASGPGDVTLARALFVEYAKWLKVDLCFQGFDRELAMLPGAYAPPRGRLLLAGAPAEAFGCIALRPVDVAGAPPESIGEVKRLYVQPEVRGGGWGRRLAEALLAEARVAGYRELKLDTLEWMTDARALYAGLGFHSCEPYYHNPLSGAVYMTLTL